PPLGLAAGDLPISSALLAIPALWLFAVAAGLCISAMFLGVLAAYLATTIAYSLVLKRKMLVDVVTLAGFYTLRIIARCGRRRRGVVGMAADLLAVRVHLAGTDQVLQRAQHAPGRGPRRSLRPRLQDHRPADHRR